MFKININRFYLETLPRILFLYSILVDCINGILQESYNIILPIAVIYRAIIILWLLPFIFKNIRFWGNKLIISILIIYCCALFLWPIISDTLILFEINYFVRILYFYVILLYFYYYRNEWDESKLVKMVVNYGCYVSIIIIFCFFSGLGYESYGENFGFGTKGFFIAGNDLGLTLLFTLGLGIYSFLINRRLSSGMKLISIIIACFFIGSRAGWFGSFLLIFFSMLYCILKKDYTIKLSLDKRIFILLLFVLLGGYLMGQVLDFIYSLDSYVLDKISLEGIINARTSLIVSAQKIISDFGIISSFIGNGVYNLFRFNAELLGTNGDYRMIEADYYEIIGAFGYVLGGLILILYIVFFLKSFVTFMRCPIFKNYICCMLLMLFLGISYNAGHAITNTMLAPIYAVVVVLVYKNYHDDREKCVRKNISCRA